MRNRVSQELPLVMKLLTAESDEDYLSIREFMMPRSWDVPEFLVINGFRPGTKYAVFTSASALFEFTLILPWVFDGCPIASVLKEDNAFDITHWKGS